MKSYSVEMSSETLDVSLITSSEDVKGKQECIQDPWIDELLTDLIEYFNTKKHGFSSSPAHAKPCM